jgi:hypothetical protein
MKFHTITLLASCALQVRGARHSNLVGDGFTLDSGKGSNLEVAEDADCVVPGIDPHPDRYHLNVYQSSKNISSVQAANDNNRHYFPRNTTIHTLSDSDLIERVAIIAHKLERCAGIRGALEAFMDLRPMAYRADLYRAFQLWDTGGMWLDDKIFLRRNFSTFVDVSRDSIILPKNMREGLVTSGHAVHE